MTGFLAEAVDAIADTLECTIHFKELVVFIPEQVPKGVAVFLLLRGLRHVAAEHVGGGDRLGEVLRVRS